MMETEQKSLPEFITTSRAFELLEAGENRFTRDIGMNWKGLFSSQSMTAKEVALVCLALAVNSSNEALKGYFRETSVESGATAAEIADAIACASMLAANNVFYRFRHFLNDANYDGMPARIRMQAMMNPACGKDLFELMSLAVSAVNGCEKCVVAHERSLRELGVSREKIWESIRLTSVFESARRLV